MEADLGFKESTQPNGSLTTRDQTYDSGKVDAKINGQINGEACGTSADHYGSVDQGQAYHLSKQFDAEPIAIIGMACRFPGDAVNVKGLWDMCCEGRSAWSEVAESRMSSHSFFHPDFSKRGTVGPTPLHASSRGFDSPMVVQHARGAFHEARHQLV